MIHDLVQCLDYLFFGILLALHLESSRSLYFSRTLRHAGIIYGGMSRILQR
jgi:hypothetical protein